MRLMKAISKASKSVTANGPRETAKIVWKNILRNYGQLQNRHFDHKHKVDTGGRIEVADLNTNSASATHAVRYEPTTLRTFHGIMRNLPADLRDFTFVDFGSGKGWAMMLASRYRFRRIVGIEYAACLHAIARQNLLSFRDQRQKCFDLEAVHGDATEFAIPATPCVFYFYQPFAGEVMARVLGIIERSLAARPRESYLVFLHPHASLNRGRDLSFVHRMKTRRLPLDLAYAHSRELEIYTSTPSLADEYAPQPV